MSSDKEPVLFVQDEASKLPPSFWEVMAKHMDDGKHEVWVSSKPVRTLIDREVTSVILEAFAEQERKAGRHPIDKSSKM